MLNKLLKYEFKATGRIFIPLFIALVLFAGITRLFSSINPGNLVTPARISMVIYIIIMVAMFIMTFIMMIQRFYKNLLSDEGYLMFTLPVKPWKHILSKLLVTMFWIVTSVITAFISICIIALNSGDTGKITGLSIAFHDQIIELLGTLAYILAFEVILAIFTSLSAAILIIYTSIAIGHLFNKHKMLASFGAFIMLNTLTQIIFMLIGNIPFFHQDIFFDPASPDFLGTLHIMHLAIAYGIIFTGIISTAYFFITNYILSKHLNLE